MSENLTTILQAATLLSFIIGFVWGTTRVAILVGQITHQIQAMQDDIAVLNKLLVEIAVQKQRLDAQGERLNMLDRRYEDLRRGKGRIVEDG